MTFMLSSSVVEWSRPLMIGWIVIALALSAIEVFWIMGGLSSRRVSKVN
ncbi:MAG TPA: hypothetical protein VJT69_13395 [Pyrinomonadaceae bacterium]|nr:hypothetical protein [Pyrinomonadaceae bacterium]